MATSPSTVDVNGIFKEAYADKITSLVPDNVYYTKKIPAVSKEKQPGANYNKSVTLTSEQGITMSASDAGAFTLNAPIAMNNKQASIKGTQLLLRSAFDYESIFNSRSKNAFIDATKLKIKNMIKSMYFYNEANIMWGQRGIGTVSSVSTNTVTVTTAEWAPAFWLGSENREILFETSGGVLRGTASVTSYDIDAREVTFDSLPSGVASTDVMRFSAQGLAGVNTHLGIYDIITSSGSTLFGIDQSSYGMWQSAGSYSAGSAPLNFNKVMNAINQGVNKGLGDEINEIEVVVSTGGWTDLNKDLAALREFDSSYKREEGDNGFENIVYYCTAGKVRIVPLKTMKEGYAFVHPMCSRAFERIGSQPEPTFALPGQKDGQQEQFLRPMENNAGVESRLYANTSLFTDMVHTMVLVTGIVNSES